MIYQLIGQMKKQLIQMNVWFDAAAALAEEKSFPLDSLLTARLAPDQWPLSTQIQIACDTLKLGASRLSDKEAPKHEDKETSFAEYRSRIESVIAYLDSLSESDFAQASEKSISLPYWKGKSLSGTDYFMEHFMPNFYFHLSHSYAILRHNGVNVGKRSYLGTMSYREPAA